MEDKNKNTLWQLSKQIPLFILMIQCAHHRIYQVLHFRYLARFSNSLYYYIISLQFLSFFFI